ncbi:uncharacterized protein LOC107420658 [Ziziphus jujuba]|uniref:Uncharacterized protein LOC107420658 n=2 Tax=Ziziphus jujuba TaxID=326968 RepID=A0A6P3ZXF1_ZIZJJ|nr:uncharacterized protein LOC107420658 [Ziziphus jujuba]KAH7524236.1 hypothetical protein FEM48_Zijuj06G0097800 [Ziziphus jujuba var. spinosa]
MGLTGACTRLLGDLVQTFGGRAMVTRSRNSEALINVQTHPTCTSTAQNNNVDDSMVRALITVFGMETSGRIKKEKARKVVEKLGLICCEEKEEEAVKSRITSTFDLPGSGDHEQEVMVEEVLGEGDGWKKRNELLREAFNIFDEDGNGFIEAVELKRVLECLGLMDKGWDMDQIEKMLRVVDLNLDGKVDFDEFELMMGVNCN